MQADRPKKQKSLWTREEPGTRKPKHSRAKIAEVAITIADAEGFEAVTMRRVAQELGASTMSLYYYVKTRGELLALMDDALMAELLVMQHGRGAQALLEIGLATSQMLRRHPWALSAMRGAPPGPNALRHAEQCLDALADTKLSPKQKLTLLAMVDDYVFGHALREVEAETPIDEALARELLATGDFPHLEKTYSRGRHLPEGARLKHALQALIGSVMGTD